MAPVASTIPIPPASAVSQASASSFTLSPEVVFVILLLLCICMFCALGAVLLSLYLKRRSSDEMQATDMEAQSKITPRRLILPSLSGSAKSIAPKPLLLPLMVTASTPRVKASLFSMLLAKFKGSAEIKVLSSKNEAGTGAPDVVDSDADLKAKTDLTADWAQTHMASFEAAQDVQLQTVLLHELNNDPLEETVLETKDDNSCTKPSGIPQDHIDCSDSASDITDVLQSYASVSFPVGLSLVAETASNSDIIEESAVTSPTAPAIPEIMIEASMPYSPTTPSTFTQGFIGESVVSDYFTSASEPASGAPVNCSAADLLQVPAMSWTAPRADPEPEQSLVNISNISGQTFNLSAPPPRRGKGKKTLVDNKQDFAGAASRSELIGPDNPPSMLATSTRHNNNDEPCSRRQLASQKKTAVRRGRPLVLPPKPSPYYSYF